EALDRLFVPSRLGELVLRFHSLPSVDGEDVECREFQLSAYRPVRHVRPDAIAGRGKARDLRSSPASEERGLKCDRGVIRSIEPAFDCADRLEARLVGLSRRM